MKNIDRKHITERMSQLVTHGDTIYLAGQVGKPGDSVVEQTSSCLEAIDRLLTEAGSDNKHILQATIWLATMRDFSSMNEVWDAWVPEGYAPARACAEAKLATEDYLVEIIIIAAKK